MMKKLLVLVLVLMVSTMASAALTDLSLTTDGTTLFCTGLTGSAYEYSILENAVIDIIVPNEAVIFTDALNVGNNDKAAGDLASASVATVPPGDIFFVSAKISPADGDSISVGDHFATAVNLNGSFAAGDVVASLTVFEGQSVAGTLDVTYVPEPVTVALLGLGGLFIRRRK